MKQYCNCSWNFCKSLYRICKIQNLCWTMCRVDETIQAWWCAHQNASENRFSM